MEQRILNFIAALRAGGVRVSLAESEDAFNAVDHLGVKHRETFRLSLRATLIKDAGDLETFDELFSVFFGGKNTLPPSDLTEDMTEAEAQMLAEALRQFGQMLREMMERMLRGEQLSQDELDRLGDRVGLSRIRDMRYRDWMVRRMQQALRHKEIQEALNELLALLREMGMDQARADQLRQLLGTNQAAQDEQLEQYAGERIAENMVNQPEQDGIERLLNRPFSALSDEDIFRLRKEVRRLAAALRTRVALRQKRAKTGQLDAKATIRANLKHGSVPFAIKHKNRRLKPKLVVLCDISTSMRHISEFMLTLLYTLQDQISKTHAFAFIDHLEYISPDFAGKDVEQAVAGVLGRLPAGYYNTDLGYSLENFSKDFMDSVDSRTSFILVGDGRNNYNDPGLDILRRIGLRSHRVIWLNPESPVLWGSGDSDMLDYAPLCDVILQVSNLKELTSAVDQLLSY